MVFLDGKLLREGPDFIWVHERVLIKTPISSKAHLTIVDMPASRKDYGHNAHDIYRIIDPAQKWVGVRED